MYQTALENLIYIIKIKFCEITSTVQYIFAFKIFSFIKVRSSLILCPEKLLSLILMGHMDILWGVSKDNLIYQHYLFFLLILIPFVFLFDILSFSVNGCNNIPNRTSERKAILDSGVWWVTGLDGNRCTYIGFDIFVLFWGWVLSPDWPQTHCPSTSISWALGYRLKPPCQAGFEILNTLPWSVWFSINVNL